VESTLDQGSTFTVSIPLGKEHIPADRIGAEQDRASTRVAASAYVEEALRWLPAPGPVVGMRAAPDLPSGGARPRVLLADDNTDMREYVRKQLSSDREVAAVADGEAAWAAIQEELPDLLLTDVIMPKLDGFALLAAQAA
jgi:hypothetical protein